MEERKIIVVGMDYARVIFPRYEVILQVDEDVYSYHSDEGQFKVFLRQA